VVLDRRRPPIDVACGEGIMPFGVRRLRELGVEIGRDAGAEFAGIRYIDGELTAEADFPGCPGIGVRRATLHNELVRRAEELATDLCWGVAVRGLVPGGFDTDTGVVTGRWLAAADGRASRVRNWAGLEAKGARQRRFGVRRHYEIAPWSDRVEVHWADRCEAYVTPVGPRCVGLALLWDGGKADFDRLLEGFPALRRRLRGSALASRDRGAGPFGTRCRSVTVGELALVGDAAGSLDPISGEGLSIAFSQAFELVAAIEAGDLGRYRLACRRLRRVPFLVTRLLLVVERNRPVRRLLMRALAGSDDLFSSLLALVSGDAGLRLGGRGGLMDMALELVRVGVLRRTEG
jgi:2-polyprenyl-6-methoxyphenol hydroxylase-like FAD-dependent oxidoreductase